MAGPKSYPPFFPSSNGVIEALGKLFLCSNLSSAPQMMLSACKSHEPASDASFSKALLAAAPRAGSLVFP